MTVAVPADLHAVVDPAGLDRMVSNLVANSMRHGKPPVTVTAAGGDRHLRLVVEDRGDGVPPEFVPRLFDRFARSPDSRRRGEGSGLGLSIVQEYARAHGGDIVYEPAVPHGARFEVVIPFRARGRPSPGRRSRADAQTSRCVHPAIGDDVAPSSYRPRAQLSTVNGKRSRSTVSGSGPPRTPVSSESIAATSSGVSEKSKTSMFSSIRCGLTDFGIVEISCSMCQRSTTCAGVFPWLLGKLDDRRVVERVLDVVRVGRAVDVDPAER